MRVLYNGIDIGVLRTNVLESEPVYDDSGTDYLYSRVTVSVRGVVNGQAEFVSGAATNGPYMTYVFAPPSTAGPPGPATRPTPNNSVPRVPGPIAPGVTVPVGAGVAVAPSQTLRGVIRAANAPPLTHAVVRHRLSVPRGKLFIFSGPGQESGLIRPGTADPPVTPPNTLLVAIPEDPLFPCDPKNGPFPRLLGVYEVYGDSQTFVVDWACEGYVLENANNGLNPTGSLLSNRFAETHWIDDDGFTTAAVQGEAVFRADFLDVSTVTPDTFRPILFMPIAQGFVRENILVEGIPDVIGVKYQYTDRQVWSNFTAAPYVRAAQIQVNHKQKITSGNILATIEGFVGMAANAAFARSGIKDAFAGGERKTGLAKAMADKWVSSLKRKP